MGEYTVQLLEQRCVTLEQMFNALQEEYKKLKEDHEFNEEVIKDYKEEVKILLKEKEKNNG